MESLLGYIAKKSSLPTENIATQALAYLLNTSTASSDAVRSILLAHGVKPPGVLTIDSHKAGDDGCIPDLKVIDANKNVVAIIENKFWARLTRNQPVAYFRQLNCPPGLVLFVVPKVRCASIWTELIECCDKAGLCVRDANDGRFTARVDDHVLAVCSWSSLLGRLRKACLGKKESISTVREIERVAQVTEQEKFAPLHSKETHDPKNALRVLNYITLANDIVEKAKGSKLFHPNPRLRGAGQGWSGMYGKMEGFEAWIGFDANAWVECGHTPLWVQFEKADELPLLKAIFDAWLRSNPKRCYPFGRHLAVPILLRAGISRKRVIDSALSAVYETAALLARSVKNGAPRKMR